MTSKNILIVGAGPGGLAAAINLAGLGHKVTVVEKENTPGGRMRGLRFGDYEIDTGPTILQLPQVLETVFSRSGKRIEDYVTLKRLDPNTRIHFWDGTFLDTSSNVDRMRDSLAQLSSSHPAAFDKWMKENSRKYTLAYEKFICTRAHSLGYYSPTRLWKTLQFQPWQSLHSHLDSFFRDDRVNYALSYPSKYLGLHPTTCSSIFSVIPYIELQFGVWHVMGGFRALARGMAQCAQDLSATFLYQSAVQRILTRGGRVEGVQLSNGEKLFADAVVVNADLAYAATQLIDEEERKHTAISNASLESSNYSCSTFMLYIGLDKKYDHLPHHLIYLSNNARKTDRDSLNDVHVDFDDPPFYVCNSTPTDSAGAPEGHSCLYMLIPTPNTSQHVDWKNVEKLFSARALDWLAKVGISDVTSHIKSIRTLAAPGWRDDFNVFRGAVFNLSHTFTQLGPLRPKVKSKSTSGLYWVGGGTHPGSGLLTIFESANIAADHIAEDFTGGKLPQWPMTPRVESAFSGTVAAFDATLA